MNSINTNANGLLGRTYDMLQLDPSLQREQRNRLGGMLANFAHAGTDETIKNIAPIPFSTNLPIETGHLTTRIVIPKGLIDSPDHLVA